MNDTEKLGQTLFIFQTMAIMLNFLWSHWVTRKVSKGWENVIYTLVVIFMTLFFIFSSSFLIFGQP